MSRQPTEEEIKETNPNMTKTCDKCFLVVNADRNFGTFENMLTLNLSGGYCEFVDSIAVKNPEELEFALCHKCAHAFFSKFLNIHTPRGYHPKTSDKFCEGWTLYDTGEASA